ncbi:MAG TPA: response regulator transcription factor [Verrucomicrobiae bacterium]|nr:response regulator transcription factor [Verrucomicrobiae bacterium]
MEITVCIVEDDPELRESVFNYLEGAPGFRCLGAYGMAEEALKEIPRVSPAVVLMDINLPAMSGIECVERLKTLAPDVQVMMFTVYEDSDQVFEALVAGACGYMVKSTPPEKVLEAIREVYNGGSPMSSHIARKVVKYFHQARAGREIESLSRREEEVLHHLAQGCLYKEIADRLNISIDTVRKHLNSIYGKLHVHSRTDAVVKYLRK